MCWEINPFRFSFWGSKTACASGGGQFLFLLCRFLVTLVVFVFWSRLRRVTFQRWKVTKDRRACGPGPCVGAKSAPFRFRLKPKTALRSFAPPSPHRTRFAGLRRGPPRGGGGGDYGACKPFGCYPPFWPPPSTLRPHSAAPRADIPLAKLGSSFVGGAGPHAAFRTTIFYMIALGSSRCGIKLEVLHISRKFVQN